MIEKLLAMLLGGSGIGDVVTNGVKWASVIGSVPLVYAWFQGHAHDEIVCLNVAQTLLLAGILFVVVQIAHTARGPQTMTLGNRD